MKYHSTIFLLMILALLFTTSCNNDLDASLKVSGDNRKELEKVLNYFENDEDPLKLKSAEFLIENMPCHSTYYGKQMNQYIEAYNKMGIEAQESRDSVWGKLSDEIKTSSFK